MRHSVSVTSVLPAPAERIYGIVADYRTGHPRILPPGYFSGLEVESGGVGAGTVIRFTMTVLGRTREARAVIEEPEPGRVLVERMLTDDAVTTFRVEPASGGRHARVTIETALTLRDGLLGRIQRAGVTRTLQRIYREELGLLARVAMEE